MKSRTLTYAAVITLLGVLSFPAQLAAQDKQHGGPKHHHYKFIDIGTLGGPHSYFSGGGFGAQILNHRGTIAGYGDTPFPDPYAPNCFDLDCYVAHAFRWQHGEKTDLGSLPGTNSSAVSAINGRGGIAGFSQNGQIDPLTGSPETEAVFWKNDEIVPLGTLGGNESLAIALNDHSQVVGAAANGVPDNFSMFGWGVQSRAFLWEKGALQDLGTLGGPDAGGGPGIGNPNIFGIMCINDRRQVAGASYTNSTPDPVLLVPTTDPFLWEKGKGMQDLGTLGGTLGVVNSLNNRGQVVGQSNLVGNLSAHAFLWDEKDGMTDLGTLGGSYSAPAWISDSGQVVGQANTQNDQAFHSTLWKGGKISDLGTVDGDCSSAALAVNFEGQIVGWSFACDFSTARAYIWENGSMIDLNTLIPPNSSLKLIFAANISDRGEVAGVGIPPGDPFNTDLGRLFLLIPCDENHPGIEDCDYSMVDAPTAVPQTSPSVRDASSRSLPPSLMRRMSRYRFPGPAFGPRN